MSSDQTKTYDISRREVWEAWLQVKANQGGMGVDRQSLEDFEKDLRGNLYKVWNRMASGSYMPPPVREVKIPKKSGGERRLGIPTVSDRVAQSVVKARLEPRLERVFHPDSYGYRPLKSAHDAIEVTRRRCWKFDWVIDLDIKGFFDNIDHRLLLKAVDKHVDEKWIRLYLVRWLKAPVQDADTGELRERNLGTPQGGVVSPLLANLFLHYVFDDWMRRNHPATPFARYADDGVVHCRSYGQAQDLLKQLKERFRACGLELHPTKTKLVYCKDDERRGRYTHEKFDFLGYTFRARRSKNWRGKYFVNFSPGMSAQAATRVRQEIRSWKLPFRSDKSLADLARMFNAKIQGWINYYGRFYKSELNYKVFKHLNRKLAQWAMRKFKKLRGHRRRARQWLRTIAHRERGLWAHWKFGQTP
jgi:group II intron reverse transcriptase/maturase